MALFSFRHSVKTFSARRTVASRAAKAGQTAAHLRYITRPSAARVVLHERLEGGTRWTAAFRAEQDAVRRKGRVCERFVIALPREATPGQREALTRAFAEKLSKGIAGFVAAIHDHAGNDAKNPHAHFVFFDVHTKSGGRGRPRSTLSFSHKNAIQKAAQMWTELHNEKMQSWGFGPESGITHLSYTDQGIDQIPTIHEGAGSRAQPHKRKPSKIQWLHIDEGHSRAEANTIIREINQLNKDVEDAGTIRLGAGVRSDNAECDGCIPEQRKCGGGDGQTATRNRSEQQKDQQGQQHYYRPRDCSKLSDRAPKSSAEPASSSFPPFLAKSRVGFVRRLRRRRNVRRIYRELIILRVSLRGKLIRRKLGNMRSPLSLSRSKRSRAEAEDHGIALGKDRGSSR
jgi:hypothetical protein